MSNKGVKILSDVVVYTKYAKFLASKERREGWDEITYRNMDMHIEKYPKLKVEILNAFNNYVLPKKVLMSMRSAQFAGKPIQISPNRMYNCCYLPIDDYRAFSETMFLLLGGTGVGYSVQSKHIEKLPEIKKPTKSRRFLVQDSIEGWADAVKALFKSYMKGASLPTFDFSDIRDKGAPLITSGGKAPGPEPLKVCLFNLKRILDRKEDGDQLTTLEVHDLMCFIADAVLAGGIRRAAMISLFDIDDQEMLTCKFGTWYETNPQRGRANNSAVALRHRITEKKFKDLFGKIKASGSGDPGIYFSNNADLGTNPCVETSLKPFQFCNLVEQNVSDVKTQKELNTRAKIAAFMATLQAGFTDFHYLRDIWKRTTEKDALIGVSMTGIANTAFLKLDMSEAAEIVKKENERVAKIIGVNPASRTTCVKPAGSTSSIIGCSSGIHDWEDEYYIRRMRIGKDEAIYDYLLKTIPELLEDEFFKPEQMAVLSIPVKSPDDAIIDKSALELLERIKKVSIEWIRPGHRKGDNYYNVSATVEVKDDEWDVVGKWMWDNREYYNGLAIFPKGGGNHKQLPFEPTDKETYEKLAKYTKKIDLTKVIETQDNTNLSGEIACGPDGCEIK